MSRVSTPLWLCEVGNLPAPVDTVSLLRCLTSRQLLAQDRQTIRRRPLARSRCSHDVDRK